jgi:predicted nucleotidyltransferase
MSYLNELLGNRVSLKIIEFFLNNPSKEFTWTDINRKLKIAKASTTKWLSFLLSNNFLVKIDRSGASFYKLNQDFEIVKQTKVLYNLTALIPFFKKPIGARIFLYGSASRGEDKEDSDIDLLIIGERTKEILKTIRELESKLNRRVKPSFYTEFEWSQMARKDPAFYERVERDKIKLI